MKREPEGTTFQSKFVADVHTICRANRRLLTLSRVFPFDVDRIMVCLELNTTDLEANPKGLPAQPVEQVFVEIPPTPFLPPRAWVTHSRFVGFPHVLQGHNLCVYLDPDREWDPAGGASEFLDRLLRWFKSAIAGEFRESTALYHPVGGVLHETKGTPTVVCREELDYTDSLSIAYIAPVTEARVDLTLQRRMDSQDQPALVITLPRPLVFGAGETIGTILQHMDQSVASAAWERLKLFRMGRHRGRYIYFVLAVPYEGADSMHLIVGRVLSQFVYMLAKEKIPVEWCSISDERPSISTRRDSRSAVSAFAGKRVVLLGVGGLGSWIGEFIARAAAKQILISDPGRVKGGLTVRQNYIDADIGRNKAKALQDRLSTVGSGTEVLAFDDAIPEELMAQMWLDDQSIIIDATVSNAVARWLASLQGNLRKALLAQVSTDSRSGSLGLLIVAAPSVGESLHSLDEKARQRILSDGVLEDFHTFWKSGIGDELVPARGCSVPTFHGSAADMAAVAAEHTNLIARHIESDNSAIHLFALPHTKVHPKYFIIPAAHLFVRPKLLATPA